jgi:hypothetical protein
VPGQGQAFGRETAATRNPARPKKRQAAEKVGEARTRQSEERREAADAEENTLGELGIAAAAGCTPRSACCPDLGMAAAAVSSLARRAMCARRFRQFSRVQPISNHFNDIYFGLIGLLH